MKRALWPCRWQVNAHAVSNVSSPSSLWLETSWRALSDKMHFPSQTSFLHSGWFLALAANAPNLWCQFYFRFYFCQQCCVLEFDFAPHSEKNMQTAFSHYLSPLGLTRTGQWLNIDLSHSLRASLHDTTHNSWNHRLGFLLCHLLSWLAVCLLSHWLFSGVFFLLACKGNSWKRHFFYEWGNHINIA